MTLSKQKGECPIQLLQVGIYLLRLCNNPVGTYVLISGMRKVLACVMIVACSCQLGKLSLEEEVEKRLEEVLLEHIDAWKKIENGVEGDRDARTGFPAIKRKRKKIRACQNMAGNVRLSPLLYV